MFAKYINKSETEFFQFTPEPPQFLRTWSLVQTDIFVFSKMLFDHIYIYIYLGTISESCWRLSTKALIFHHYGRLVLLLSNVTCQYLQQSMYICWATGEREQTKKHTDLVNKQTYIPCQQTNKPTMSTNIQTSRPCQQTEYLTEMWLLAQI